MDVRDLRCLVTGTASGIGDAVARRLIDGGASVVSLDRNKPSADITEHVEVDLADPSSIDTALEQIDGTVDAVVNVAGVPGTAPPETVFAVNFLGMRHLTESMFERINPGGSIVVVSSTAGFQWPARLDTHKEVIATESFAEGAAWFRDHPQQGNAYNFAKEAATVYTLAMGGAVREMGDLRINAVLPGPVETPILGDFEQSMGKETLEGIRAFLGRHAEAEDIALPIVFLAGRESRWINGATLVADGGITGAVSAGLVPAPEI